MGKPSTLSRLERFGSLVNKSFRLDEALRLTEEPRDNASISIKAHEEAVNFYPFRLFLSPRFSPERSAIMIRCVNPASAETFSRCCSEYRRDFPSFRIP